MTTLNLGILAHVDAGKTSLTERLLYAGGVIGELGSGDDGSTLTDSLALERERGITIKSAVASFAIDDLTVNLIDTPGHPDFIAEVERVLQVLDGAVLVVSAVEGVQAQTRVLMRALQRLRLPTLIFINKIDRVGARDASLLERLSLATVPMATATRAELLDVLTLRDDELLAAAVREDVSPQRLRQALAAQTKQAVVHPVYLGSAITGAGVDALTAGIKEFLPSIPGDMNAPLSGVVFKVERGDSGEKIAYVRLFAGTIRVRDRVAFGNGHAEKVTAMEVFDRGGAVSRSATEAGQIAKLYGLSEVRIGDFIGVPPETSIARFFTPPSLETVVVPVPASAKGALHVALTQLAEQDPLINLRQDEQRQELSLSLYGEVQKEVIQTTLARDFGVDVTFRETTTICIEKPVGTGEAAEFIAVAPNPFLATVGLRVTPSEPGSGNNFHLGVELGSMPPAFFKAVEESVFQTLEQGLHGWSVTDCTVTMTRAGYWARQSHSHGTFDKSMSSTAGDFRNLTPLVLMSALRQAGTRVFEPVHSLSLELPAELFPHVLPVLARSRASLQAPIPRGNVSFVDGHVPAANVHELQQQLPGLTRGEGVLETAFDHYQPVKGAPSSRARIGPDPLNRKEYLLHIVRRIH